MDVTKIKSFYKNKKVFITGHSGFKGIWLSFILKFLGANVLGYSYKLKKNDKFIFFKKTKRNFKSKFGDILNYDYLKKNIKDFKPHIVFHFAAQSLVIESQKNPKKTFETNVIGTNNIIDICLSTKSIKSLIIATSDKCYKNNSKKIKFNESSELGGDEPYSISKSLCEHLIKIYQTNSVKKIKFGISSVRAGNVIGGGDFNNRLVPDIINSTKKKKILIRNPKHIRPWQYIIDVCHAYLLIPIYHYKNYKKYSGPYNIGPNRKNFISVQKLTKKLSDKISIKFKIKIKKQFFKEKKFLFLNSSKIRKLMNWKPLLDIEETLKETAEWYKFFFNKKNIIKKTLDQIKFYYYQ